MILCVASIVSTPCYKAQSLMKLAWLKLHSSLINRKEHSLEVN